eukprot:5599778-Amphidinium_carterae.1
MVSVAANPPWPVLLSYEYECRKWIYKRIREGTHSLAVALDEVVSNSELREIFFISPLLLHGKRSLPASAAFATQQPAKYQKGMGKNAKGKKGAQAPKSPKLHANLADGTQICFNFNGVGCSNTQCSRAH